MRQTLFTALFSFFMLSMPLGNTETPSSASNWSHDETICCDPCCTICCPPKDECAKCAQLWPTCGPDRIVTPGAGPCVRNGWDLFLTLDFIYWTVREDKLGFANRIAPEINLLSPVRNRGQTIHPVWGAEPGFKVGLGWLTCLDGWDLFFEYTWLRPGTAKGKALANQPIPDYEIEPLASWVPEINGATEKIVGRWDMDVNIFDLELGRNFYISSRLHLRPFFGLKGASFDQSFTVSSFASGAENATNLSSYELDWWGLGARAGLRSSWQLCPSLSLFGNVAGSALWGRFRSHMKETIHSSLFSNPMPLYFEDEFRTSKPVVETEIGIRYENWFCCDSYYFSLQAGWEVQWWRRNNQFTTSLTETRNADLGFQGLTLRGRFQF